ncbi:MAG: hypothetical protein ABEJ93_00350 [Candidatus Nanohalobium sp.]
MKPEIQEKEEGYLITLKAKEELALAVQSSSGERIYLPGEGGTDSTYYNENPQYLVETEQGYQVLHSERPEKIEVIN